MTAYYLVEKNGNNLLKEEGGMIYLGNDAGEWYWNQNATRMFQDSTELIGPLTLKEAKAEAKRIWPKGHTLFSQ